MMDPWGLGFTYWFLVRNRGKFYREYIAVISQYSLLRTSKVMDPEGLGFEVITVQYKPHQKSGYPFSLSQASHAALGSGCRV